MSLASKIAQKLSAKRYELEFEEYGVSVFLEPLTVEQRSKLIKLDDEIKQQILAFLSCAYDEEGEPAAKNEKEVKALPESIVGVSVAIIMLLTQGASHETIDKYVEGYNDEMNPFKAEGDELNPNQ